MTFIIVFNPDVDVLTKPRVRPNFQADTCFWNALLNFPSERMLEIGFGMKQWSLTRQILEARKNRDSH